MNMTSSQEITPMTDVQPPPDAAHASTAHDIHKLRERMDIEHALRAGIPILYVETFEEIKLTQIIHAQFSEAKSPDGKEQKVSIFQWTQTQGLREMVLSPDGRVGLKNPLPETLSLRDVLKRIDEMAAKPRTAGTQEAQFFFLLDPPFNGDFSWEARKLRDLALQLRATRTRIVLVCPNMTLPLQLTRDVQRIDLPLPSEAELEQVLDRSIRIEAKSLEFRGQNEPVEYSPRQKQHVTRAALGLTESQAGDTFAKSSAALGRIDPKYVVAEKEKLIKVSSNEILEFHHPRESLNEVCGIEKLQEWLRDIEMATMSDLAREHGLAFPRGILLIGIPGCGKSMTVKAIANSWNLPLIRMDVQRAFSKYIGETESHIDNALRFVEVIAPCVLWVDEVEKGFAGFSGDNTGTTTRIFGKFLTWMQEHEAPVFLACTANRLEALPVEFSRAGRFTKIWFLGWPDREARAKLFEVHLRMAFARHPALENVQSILQDERFGEVLDRTNEWTGAEVESIVHALLRSCELAGQRAAKGDPESFKRESIATLNVGSLLAAIDQHRPMSVTHRDQIEHIKKWVKEHDVECAGTFSGAEEFEFVNEERILI